MSNQLGYENNVECRRCGNQWYSEKFREHKETPKYCTKCHQPSVQKIVPPPTKFEEFKKHTRQQIASVPGKIRQKRDDIRDFKETNRMLVSMANTAIIITLITGLAIYFIFLR